MYLNRLLNMKRGERKKAFLKIIEAHKTDLMDEKNLEGFTLIYPEIALDFAYIADLKQAVSEFKEEKAIKKAKRLADELVPKKQKNSRKS